MKISDLNKLPIDKLQRFCKQFKIALECHDGEVRRVRKI